MRTNLLYPFGSRLSRSTFDRDRDAYSATDIEAVVYGKDRTTGLAVVSKIGDIQTLTYSVHREKSPVRTLGRSNPVGYTSGGRTAAGSLIFATFNRRALEELYTGSDKIDFSVANVSDARIRQPSDTIPPFDIVLYFTSEQGNDSIMTIYRVELVDEGQTFSVQDVYTEHTMQYICGPISMMERVDDIWRRGAVGEGAIFKNVTAVHKAEAKGLVI
jgi:hypothetical protein